MRIAMRQGMSFSPLEIEQLVRVCGAQGTNRRIPPFGLTIDGWRCFSDFNGKIKRCDPLMTPTLSPRLFEALRPNSPHPGIVPGVVDPNGEMGPPA